MPFTKGHGGRKKGARNKVSVEVEQLCGSLITDKRYQATFRKRFLAGELPPRLEEMVWAYWAGRPIERHALEGDSWQPLFVLPAGVTVKTQ